MKKLLMLAGLCLAICSSVVAQDFGQGGRQGGQRGPRRQMDAVVDTAIINHMDLNQEVLQQVYKLQEAKQAEQKEAMGNMRQRGQRMSEEGRKEFMEKQQAFTAQYRKELRALIGDENYITYLEKMLDRRPMFGGMQRGGMPRGQMGGGQGFGGGQPGGGFDNGFGGGF